ncbi:MAG: D-alanyl-D-alanine carboxypeptidase [Clostridia bacterium]|nr:D-alanyl-D-alanine carboxypeptidase [Clostridia bacterium]
MFKKILIFCMLFLVIATTCSGGMHTVAFAEGEVDISSKSACLVDYASGTVLYEKDANKHLPIASMVKMMTILLTLDEIDAGNLTETDMITTSENASGMGGSQVFIDPYVEYSAGDLLKSVIIASANDASVALAEHISGSEKAFVSKMNERAQELDMKDTHYVNCTGLPAPEQYSCAKDCAIVLKEVTNHEIYHKYSTIWMDEITHPSGRKTEVVNTNRLVRYYDGCDGGKTGSTNEAGCCLSASAKRNNMRLISVIIGAENSQTRFNECSKLFNYGFANFESKEIVGINNPLLSIAVNKGKCDAVDLYANEGYSVVAKKGEKPNIDVDFSAPEKVNAPTKQGDVVGKAIISQDGNLIKEIDLIIKADIDALSLKDCFDKVVYSW